MSQVCRTCLKKVDSSDFVSISEPVDALSVGVKHELAICVPELDLDKVANAVVCASCVNDLHTAYRFKNTCLQTEKRIQLYAQNMSGRPSVDLSHIISCNAEVEFVPISDPLLMADIKEEPSTVFLDDGIGCNSQFEEHLIKIEAVSKTKNINNCYMKNEAVASFTEGITCKEETINRSYNCTQCNFSSTQSKDLIRHVQMHIKQPLIVNATTLKRKTFTIEDKVDLIKRLESGKKMSEVCRESGLAMSTMCCIWKNKETILGALERNGPHLKRLRKPTYADVDEALFIWFKEQKFEVPITGQLLKVKALELARAMGNYDFLCSASWLDRFKARYNINIGKKRCSLLSNMK